MMPASQELTQLRQNQQRDDLVEWNGPGSTEIKKDQQSNTLFIHIH
jgi:hypothetical protein